MFWRKVKLVDLCDVDVLLKFRRERGEFLNPLTWTHYDPVSKSGDLLAIGMPV